MVPGYNESEQVNVERLYLLPVILGMAGFAVLFVMSSFLCDDAYISFHVVDNFLNGHGLVFNPGERVQAHTHPLWVFLITPLYALTGEFYYTVLGLSFILGALSVGGVLYQFRRSFLGMFAGMALLLSSKTFIDWSSGGLAIVLLYFLVTLFFGLAFSKNWNKHIGLLTLLFSLILITRIDVLLLIAPFFAYALFSSWQSKAISIGLLFKKLLIFGAPLWLWELFSLWYYGVPFPNTAYAKAFNTGIGLLEIAGQGFGYYLLQVQMDPLSVTIIVLAVCSGFIFRGKMHILWSLGIFLQCIYILKIGGDQMGGRLFAIPFLASVLLVLQILSKKMLIKKQTQFQNTRAILLGFIGISVVANFSPFAPINVIGAASPIAKNIAGQTRVIQDDGVLRIWHTKDFRSSWGDYNILTKHRNWQQPVVYNRSNKLGNVAIRGAMGHNGLFGGPNVHIIDLYGLSDPLIARLPLGAQGWGPGHIKRRIPKGYVESIITDKNRIKNPSLKEYYDVIRSITHGNLFSLQRIKNIAAFNLGFYDKYLNKYLEKYNKGSGHAVWKWKHGVPKNVSWTAAGGGVNWDRVRLKAERIKTNWSSGLAGKFGGNEYLSLEQPMKGKVKNLTVDAKFATSFQKYQILASFDRSEYFRIGTRGKKVLISLASDDDIADFDFPCDVADGVPHRLTVMFDGENTRLSLFVDDHLVGTRKTDFKYIGSSNNRRFGFIGVGSEARSKGGRIGPEAYFKGIIDKVSIYKSTPECQCPDGISSFSEGELMISETFGDNSGK